MNISSRTPEGDFNDCPIGGKTVCISPAQPAGDAPCPNCGHLLWWFRDHFSKTQGIAEDKITLLTSIPDDLAADSIDVVETVMIFEEEFGITIPDDVFEKIHTVGDAIKYIESVRHEHTH